MNREALAGACPTRHSLSLSLTILLVTLSRSAVESQEVPFRRGDMNLDGRVDVADVGFRVFWSFTL